MNWADFQQAVLDGGWLILLAYFLYKEVWPLLTRTILPAQIKASEAATKKRDEEVNHDREFREGIERDRSTAAQKTSDAIVKLSEAMVQIGTQQTTILENQRQIMEQSASILEVATV